MLDLTPILEAIKAEQNDYPSMTAHAEALGLPQPTYSMILRGTRNIGMRTLQAILTARPAWIDLLNGDDQQEL